MSAHRTKRPFAGAASDHSQRQITSFFNKATLSSDQQQQQHSPAAILRPVLPADTESNLLTVGMRVRKSVPEGYKTGSSYSAFSLFSDAAEHQPQHTNTAAATTTTTRPLPTSYTATHRELLPFCAIHAVGGLAAQPPSSPPPPIIRLDSLDDVPSLSSSQSSLASTVSSITSSAPLNVSTAFPRKRSYDAGDESDTPSVSGCLRVPSGEWMDGQVSPRSLVPVGWENTRVMAVPKRARHVLRATGVPAVVIAGEEEEKPRLGFGQENVRMVVDDDGDFSEADFLDYRALEGDAMEL